MDNKPMKKTLLSAFFLILASCQSQPSVNDLNSLSPDASSISSAKKFTSAKKVFSKKNVKRNIPMLTKIKADTTSLFPTEQGYVWNYDVVYHTTDDPYEDYSGTASMQIEKVTKAKNGTTLELRATDSVSTELTFPTITINDKNISFGEVEYLGFGALKVSDFKVDFLHLPMTAGEKWDEGSWSIQTKALEKVTIPSGTYDAWKVEVIGTYDHAYTAVGKYWIVAGIGIVKNELAVPGWTFESTLASVSKKASK